MIDAPDVWLSSLEVGGPVPLGQSTYEPLSLEESISNGSEVDATAGRVILTFALPDGTTQTAEVYGGRFLIHQDANGTVHLILSLPLARLAGRLETRWRTAGE